jgi:hypothetical protein
MLDELSGCLALGLAHGFEDARLRNPSEIIVDARRPARGDHVEIDGLGELVPMHEGVRTPVPWLLHDIDGERRAMGEQRGLAVAVELRQRAPKFGWLLRQLLGLLLLPSFDRLGRAGLRQPPAPAQRKWNASP